MSLPVELIVIVCLYFLIGAIAIITINRRGQDPQNKERWIKYWFYLLVILVTILSIQYLFFTWIALFISVMGLFEIISAWWRSGKRKAWVLIIGLFLYLVIAFGFLLFAWDSDSTYLLFTYTLIFTQDGFAQIIGQLMGRKKFLPAISPDKTLAGVVGGCAAALVISAFIYKWLGTYLPSVWILIPHILITCFGGLAGDILASKFKRICGIKDYSNLIPGHGGVLDRFDSFMLAGAILGYLIRCEIL
ncbi:MAG: phosphatidate cytidylyltransferase [Taibaiella sp.]|nr:phosphatidate cytidylyltransferase [Taibaiella sp.]